MKRSGQGKVEYVVIIAGIALLSFAALSIFGHKTSDMWATGASLLPGTHVTSVPKVAEYKVEIEPALGASDSNGAMFNLRETAVITLTPSGPIAGGIALDGSQLPHSGSIVTGRLVPVDESQQGVTESANDPRGSASEQSISEPQPVEISRVATADMDAGLFVGRLIVSPLESDTETLWNDMPISQVRLAFGRGSGAVVVRDMPEGAFSTAQDAQDSPKRNVHMSKETISWNVDSVSRSRGIAFSFLKPNWRWLRYIRDYVPILGRRLVESETWLQCSSYLVVMVICLAGGAGGLWKAARWLPSRLIKKKVTARILKPGDPDFAMPDKKPATKSPDESA